MDIDPQSAQTGAQFLANLTQFVLMYFQERRDRKQRSYDDFVRYLEFHKFDEIKDQMSNIFHLQSEVDDLLRQDHTQIITKLDALNRTLADGLARIEGFREVATIVAPKGGLSKQALWLFELVGRSKNREIETSGDGDQVIVNATIYRAEESHFLRDDLQALVSRRFLEFNMSSDRERFYRLTRRGDEAFRVMFTDAR